jgi:PAS domain S-box-containing protein
MDDSNRGDLQRLFMDNLSDCSLVLLAADGEVLTWNAGARALFGYAEADVVGRNFSCLYGQNDIEAGKPSTSLASALSQGRHEETGQRRRKDGSEVRIQDVLIPLYDPQSKLVAFGNLTRLVDRAIHSVRGPLATASGGADRKIVLLVDDDEAVRGAAVGMLDSLGYDVLVASNGQDALNLLASSDNIDVLLTDVMMPDGMSGAELGEKARRRRPNVKILFASGYFEGALVRDGNLLASTDFLVKPYRKKDLERKLDELLEELA